MRLTRHQHPLNDFYDPRRTLLADIGGLIGMAIAGVTASSMVWETLARGFKTGELEWAFFVFLAVVLGAAALGGMLGLAGGRVLGGVWEGRHRRSRPVVREESDDAASTLPHQRSQPTAAAHPEFPGPDGISLRTSVGHRAALHALLQRAQTDEGSRPSAEQLRRSIAIGAWDGERLVGEARAVSDGHVVVLANVLVDPQYRRRGIGRALVRAAQGAAPGEVWHLGALPPDGVAFLSALGAQRSSDAWRLS